jgi:hypothetical protein
MNDYALEGKDLGAKTSYFTIVTPDYGAQARVLVKSILASCNPRDVTIYIVGSGQHQSLFSDLQCDVEFAADAIGQRTYEDLATRYSAAEVCFALKPVLAEAILGRGAGQAIFVDADCLFLSTPIQAEYALGDGATAVLTPHILRSATGRHYIDDRALLRSGTINSGFFGVSATDEARALLSWWKERALADCTLDDAHGTYYEQKWLDLAPSLFSGITLIRDQGYNVAYWNLHQRKLEKTPEGKWTAGGRPLVFIHFSRWSTASMAPEEYARRHIQDPGATAASLPILQDYAAAVQAEQVPNGIDTFTIQVDDQHLPDGSRITPVMRRALWRNIAVCDGERATLVEVLNAPSPRMPQFPPYTLSNYYEEFWLSRPDLRYNKFDVDRADGLRAFTRWLVDVGQAESKIPECLMAPARKALQVDAELIKEHCVQLEAQVTSLETQILSLEAQDGSLKAQVATLKAQVTLLEAQLTDCKHANAELETQVAVWTALSKSRTFRVFRAYRLLRRRLSERTL